MTQVATPESVIGDFDDARVVAYGREFLLTRRGEEFWVNMDDPDSLEIGQSSRINRRVVLTTGSHHMQVYWYATSQGRRLGQLPVTWLCETNRWVPRSAVFISPPPQPLKSEEGRWNDTCIKCHTTHGRPRIDESRPVQVDSHVAEFGVSCEACHGPAEAHVAANRNPRRRYAQYLGDVADQTIVHPERLSHRRSSQMCGQCHGNWVFDDQRGCEEFLWHGVSYRAGDDLAESRHVFGTGQERTEFIETFLDERPHFFEDRFWPDGMIRVSGSEYNGLARSPCFLKGKLSCLSCHCMHQSARDARSSLAWANDQLKVAMEGDQACLQCHEQYRAKEDLMAHTQHEFQSAGSRCYNCHMPHTTYGLLKAIRSHQVSSPSVQESVHGMRPNACNQCHIDKTLAWTADHLETRYGIVKPAHLTSNQRRYAASLLWCLTGDAGQRALAAWTLGWAPAQQASQTDWVAPILAQLLADPYDAVRYIAHRSLRTLPEFADFEYDYVGNTQHHADAAVRAYRVWLRQSAPRLSVGGPAVLISTDGALLLDDFKQLNQLRDNREVLLLE